MARDAGSIASGVNRQDWSSIPGFAYEPGAFCAKIENKSIVSAEENNIYVLEH